MDCKKPPIPTIHFDMVVNKLGAMLTGVSALRWLGAVQLLAAIRALLATTRDSSISLIVELLSASACPAGVSVLLRMGTAGSIAASGAAGAISLVPPGSSPIILPVGLATHAAGALWAGRCSDPSKARFGENGAPTLRAAQPPRLLHAASLALGARETFIAARQRRPPAPTSPSQSAAPIASTARSEEPEELSSIAFCLDIDGTLVLTDDLYFRAFQRLLAPYGIEVDEPFYKQHIHGRADADVFASLTTCGPEEREALSRKKDELFCELYREHVAKHGPPILPGLRAALTLAREHGIRCIAVTNAPRGAAEACMASLRAAFPTEAVILSETIVVAAECARAKPHPDPYLEGMRQLGVPARRCIIFEDSPSGIKSGASAGARAVVGLASSMGASELSGLGATATLADWEGLTEEFLRALLAKAVGEGALRSAGGGGALFDTLGHYRRLARRARLAPTALLLMIGAAVGASPSAAAEATLLCRGADAVLPATAARAFAASLVPLAAASFALSTPPSDANAMVQGELPPRARRLLAASLTATTAVQLAALAQDGHALRPWARRLLFMPLAAVAASAAA